MTYFTPQRRKRKGVFPGNFQPEENFYQRSQENRQKTPERQEKPGKEPGKQAEQGVQEPAHGWAEEGEITCGSQEKGAGGVQPHPAAPQESGAEKQADAGAQPEKQVQKFLDPAGRLGQPQQAEQVVEQPQSDPNRQTEGKRYGLGLRGYAHPRNRRPRKLPWRTSSSS